MPSYTDLEMNLYESEHGYYLTAYGRDEFNELDTSNYIPIEISESDYKAFTDDDDAWYGSGDREYEALLVTFILHQLTKKAETK